MDTRTEREDGGRERETHTIYCWALQRRGLHMSQDLSVLVSGRL